MGGLPPSALRHLDPFDLSSKDGFTVKNLRDSPLQNVLGVLLVPGYA
jgi:hypothetical protein